MTAPAAGSIGVAVTIDASNLATELAEAVQKHLKPALDAATKSVGELATEIQKVDTRPMDKATDSAKKVDGAVSAAGKAAQATSGQVGKLTTSMSNSQKVGTALGTALGKPVTGIGKLGDAALSTVGKLAKFTGIAGLVTGALGGLAGGFGAVTLGMNRLKAIEGAKASLKGLGHEAESVDAIMRDALASVKGTAFGLGEAATVASSAVASGVKPGKDLERTLKLVGDAAVIARTDMSSMGAVFNKVAATGKVTGMELAQLGGMGIPILDLLGKELGKTSEEVVAMAKKGQIGFDDFRNAIEKGMGGAALKAADTFEGAMANMKAAVGRLGATLLEGPFNAAPALIGKATVAIDWLGDHLKVVLEFLKTGQFTEAFAEAFHVDENSGIVRYLTVLRTSVLNAHEWFVNLGQTIRGAFADASDATTPVGRLVEMARGWGEQIGRIFASLRTTFTDLMPALKTIGESLGKAAASVGISTWKILLDTLEILVPIIGKILVGALSAVAGWMERNQGAVTALVGAYVAYKTVMLAARAAQIAFNIAAASNPLGLLGLAIAGVVAALVLFFTKTEVGKAIWSGFVSFMGGVWDAIKAIISGAWAVLKGVFDAIVVIVQNVLMPIFKFLWDAVKVAFAGIGAVISTYWNVVKAIFNAYVFFIQNVLAPIFFYLWNTVVVPVMAGIGSVISAAWTGVIMPVWEALKAGLSAIGDAFVWLWDTVVQPIWNGLGNLITSVWEGFISPAWEAMKAGLGKVGEFFTTTVDGIRTVWEKLKGILAKPINFMIGTVYNKGIAGAWNKIADIVPGLARATTMPEIGGYKTGGKIRGPGGIDNVLMWGSAGEHMWTVNEVLKAGGHDLMYAMRDMIARGVPFTWDGGQLIGSAAGGKGLPVSSVLPYGAEVGRRGVGNVDPLGMFDVLVGGAQGYKGGGEIMPWMVQLFKGHQWARSMNGAPYTWGDNDCSGYMSKIANVVLGRGPARAWATGSFPGGQPWVPGLGPGFSVGVHDNPGGPGGGHTAGTLSAIMAAGIARAVNVESGGAHGNVAYGGPAAGADASQFAGVRPGRYHLGIGANGFFQTGGGGGGPSPAEQRGFIERQVLKVMETGLAPVRRAITGAVGDRPPEWKHVPHAYLAEAPRRAIGAAKAVIGGLGDALSSTWSRAVTLGSNVAGGARSAWDSMTHAVGSVLPSFDSGGIASGTGVMNKDVIAPERVLSPEQTALFDAMVRALETIAASGPNDPVLGLLVEIRDAIRGQAPSTAATPADAVAASTVSATGIDPSAGTITTSPAMLAAASTTTSKTGKTKTPEQQAMSKLTSAINAMVTKADAAKLGAIGVSQSSALAQFIGTQRGAALSRAKGVIDSAQTDATKKAAVTEALKPLKDALSAAIKKGDLSKLGAMGVASDNPVVAEIAKLREATVAGNQDVTAAIGDSSVAITDTGAATADATAAIGDQMCGCASSASKTAGGQDVGKQIGDAAGSALTGVAQDIAGDVTLAASSALSPAAPDAPKVTLDQTLSQQGNLIAAGLTAAGFAPADLTRAGGGGDELTTNDGPKYDARGQLYSDTGSLLDRTLTDTAAAQRAQFDQIIDGLGQMRDMLTEQALLPVLKTAIGEGMNELRSGVTSAIGSSMGDAAAPPIADAVGRAVATSMPAAGGAAGGNVVQNVVGAVFDEGGIMPHGTMGLNTSGYPERVLNPAQTRAFDAGLLGGWNVVPSGQFASTAQGKANASVGAEFFGVSQIPILGAIINLLVSVLLKVIGVDIEVRDTMMKMTDEFRSFRGDFKEYDAAGRLMNDTSALMDRSASSEQAAVDERVRILKQVIEALIKYIIEKVVVPIAKAVANAAIQAGASAAGVAISGSGAGPAGGIVSTLISSAGQAGVEIGAEIASDLGVAVGQVIVEGVFSSMQSFFPDFMTMMFSGLPAALGAMFGGLVGVAAFDRGGLAVGTGLMPKSTLQPERVLSPRQTAAFDRLVDMLGDGAPGGGRTVSIHAPFTVLGGEQGGQQVHDRLVKMLD